MVSRPFDARMFDRSVFDCNEPKIVPTLGGWAAERPVSIVWAPYIPRTVR